MTESGQKITLFMTVGGSPSPLQTALQQVQPDKACFIVSSGDDSARSSKNIVTDETVTYTAGDKKKQTRGLRFSDGCPRDNYTIDVPADDPGKALALIETQIAKERADGAHVIADYTGGTKSMTAALVMAATAHEGVKLQFMTGQRQDLVQVKGGTESATEIPQTLIGLSQTFRTIRDFAHLRNYGAAVQAVNASLASMNSRHQIRPPKAWNKRFSSWKKWLEVLDLWDHFNHKEAFSRWRNGHENGEKWAAVFAEAGLAARLEPLADLAGKPHPLLVEDLWLNALRRARLRLYDDAVARLYRLGEAAVQARLFKKYGVRTGNVDPEIIPNCMKAKLERKTNPNSDKPYFTLALHDAVALLKYHDPEDALVAVWKNREWQGARNNSILAHGFKPLGEKDWQQANAWFKMRTGPLWEDLLGRPTAEQLPHEIRPDL